MDVEDKDKDKDKDTEDNKQVALRQEAPAPVLYVSRTSHRFQKR